MPRQPAPVTVCGRLPAAGHVDVAPEIDVDVAAVRVFRGRRAPACGCGQAGACCCHSGPSVGTASARRDPRSWMTCTCWPRTSGGVITSRWSSSRGITYSFEMQPAATGAKKASVNRLTAARTAPLSFQVPCHANGGAGRGSAHAPAPICAALATAGPLPGRASRKSVRPSRCGRLGHFTAVGCGRANQGGFDEGLREADSRGGRDAGGWRFRIWLRKTTMRRARTIRSGSWARSTTAPRAPCSSTTTSRWSTGRRR